jgi:uncharacterized membrane protein YsdA (DUF1294 family)
MELTWPAVILLALLLLLNIISFVTLLVDKHIDSAGNKLKIRRSNGRD